MKPIPQLNTLPYNPDTEQAVLGAMLINFKSISQVKQTLQPSDFFKESHEHICEALFALKDKVDAYTIADYLTSKGVLEKAGGLSYIAQLTDSVITSVGVMSHCTILKELSERRKLIQVCQTTSDMAFRLESDLQTTLSSHKNEIRDIQAENNQDDYQSGDALIGQVFDDIQKKSDSGVYRVGVLTGFTDIDDKISGLEPKTVTCLAARPSMGKTALSLNIADYVAESEPDQKVIFFSLESNAKALIRRRLSTFSSVALTRIRTGNIGDEYSWERLTEAANRLAKNLIILESAKYKTIETMVSFSESIAMEDKISLIVIDHIQRMRSRTKKNSRHLEISWISEEISTLAKNLDTPIIMLSQLSRAEKGSQGRNGKPDKFPILPDLKESGDLEQNLDSVWGLWREDKDSDVMRVEGLKGRDSGTWLAWLSFDRFTQKFSTCVSPPPDDYNPFSKKKSSYE